MNAMVPIEPESRDKSGFAVWFLVDEVDNGLFTRSTRALSKVRSPP